MVVPSNKGFIKVAVIACAVLLIPVLFVVSISASDRGVNACIYAAHQDPELREFNLDFGVRDELIFPLKWRCTFTRAGRTWVLETSF